MGNFRAEVARTIPFVALHLSAIHFVRLPPFLYLVTSQVLRILHAVLVSMHVHLMQSLPLNSTISKLFHLPWSLADIASYTTDI